MAVMVVVLPEPPPGLRTGQVWGDNFVWWLGCGYNHFDADRCWASIHPFSSQPKFMGSTATESPCNKTSKTDIGLCMEHYLLIVPERRNEEEVA